MTRRWEVVVLALMTATVYLGAAFYAAEAIVGAVLAVAR